MLRNWHLECSAMPNLKKAREKGKIEDFIKEHEADPEGDLDKLDAVARSGEQEDCIEPQLQRGPALFEDRTHHRANVALAEAHVEQMLKASLVAGELLEELADVGLFHTNDMGIRLPYVKGIHPKDKPIGCRVRVRECDNLLDVDQTPEEILHMIRVQQIEETKK